jgi:hypothetical protein
MQLDRPHFILYIDSNCFPFFTNPNPNKTAARGATRENVPNCLLTGRNGSCREWIFFLRQGRTHREIAAESYGSYFFTLNIIEICSPFETDGRAAYPVEY